MKDNQPKSKSKISMVSAFSQENAEMKRDSPKRPKFVALFFVNRRSRVQLPLSARFSDFEVIHGGLMEAFLTSN